MKVEVKGLGLFDIADNDYLASGGQATIYVKGPYLFKVYDDPKLSLPELKIHDLQSIKRNEIIVPDFVVYEGGMRTGYVARYLKDFSPVCKLFSNAFWTTNSVNEKYVAVLVDKMRELIDFVHSKGCLLIDPNEMNFLFREKSLGFIDTDNYVTPKFPIEYDNKGNPKNIFVAPQIRDFTTNEFNTLTDWFGFAIVACQMFVGAHPFKGDHPGFKRQDIRGKQVARKSIFSSEVTLPNNVRDFGLIPSEYAGWFEKLFQGGERTPAPQTIGNFGVMQKVLKTIRASGKVKIELINEFENRIKWHYYYNGYRYAKTSKESILWERRLEKNNEIDFLFDKGKIGKVSLSNRTLYLNDFPVLSGVENKMLFENAIYALCGDKFRKYEFSFDRILITSEWSVMPNSTKMFDGFVFSDVLGKPYFYVPYNQKSMAQIKVEELEGKKIIAAKRKGSTIVVLTYNKGVYSRHIFMYNENFTDCNHKVYDDVNYQDVNFAHLDTGVVVVMTENGIDLMSYSKNDVLGIRDDAISGDMYLSSENGELVFFQENKLYSLSMKSRH